VASLRDYWSAERVLNMKISCKLSRRNYTHSRNCYFKRLNKSTGIWEPLWIDGVLITPPPGEKALRTLSRVIAAEYGLETKRHGKMSHISLNKLCAEKITAAIVAGDLKSSKRADGDWVVTDGEGNKVVVQEVFDKAHIRHGFAQTAVGVAFPNSSKHPCSLDHTNEFAVGESGDDWQGLRENLSEPLEAFNKMIELGCVKDVVLPKEFTDLDENINISVATEFAVGADQSGSHSGLGLGPCNCHHACPICEIGGDDMLETSEAVLSQFTRRTLERLRLLAHLVPGDCPGCNARIVLTKEDLCGCKKSQRCDKCDGKQMMVVAKVGDKPPTTKKSDLEAWLKRHFGVYYAKGPLIWLEPIFWVICILHMNLRITGAFFAHCILKELGRHTEGKPLEREAIAKQVWELLSGAGLPVKVLKCPVNETTSFWLSISKHSFAGDDCAVLACNDLWLKCLDMVMPEAARNANHTLETRYQSIIKAWRKWNEEVWPLINRLDFETKKLKADAVRKAAREFIPLFKKAVNKTPRILYLHLLVSHLPEQIEKLTVDPYFYQTQGLEHRHKMRKQYLFLMTNNRAPGEPRMTVVAAYQWLNGKTCPSFERSSGTTRGEQILELTTVRDHLRRLLTDHECAVAKQVKLERESALKKASWARRQHALRG
jgi:hypothetical protein